MTPHSTVRYPVASLDAALVWAAELAAEGERPSGLTCVGCGAPVRLHAGERNQPHFSHRNADECTGGETALHAVTTRVLADSIHGASAAHRPYPLRAGCDRCRADYDVDLARHPGCTVGVDRLLESGIRPDILVRDGDGRPRFAIEVIVTHAPEPETLTAYRDLGVPVIAVWPVWEIVPRLRVGLEPALRRRNGDSPIGHMVIENCPLPRHHRAPAAPCTTCSGPTRRLTVEVSSTACYRRGCNRRPAILDIYDHTETGPRLVAAGAGDLLGVEAVAADAGVRLEGRPSREANTTYLANICGCGALLGDNFIYNGFGDTVCTPRTTEPVRHYRWCAAGHWELVGTRRWPKDARAERHATDVVGLIGNPADLFDTHTTDTEEPLVSVRVARSDEDVRRMVRRMFGPRY